MVTAEHMALLVPRATVYSIDRYRDLCRRALFDESHAIAVAEEQAAVASRIGDPRAFWQQLLGYYAGWLASRPA